MIKVLMYSLAVAVLLLMGTACGQEKTPTDEVARDHMAAQAVLTSHYINAALQAGMSAEEINAVLMEISDQTIIIEFWVTDEEGRVEYTNMPEVDFTFPTDPNADTQAAPFAKLLQGTESISVAEPAGQGTGRCPVPVRGRRRRGPASHSPGWHYPRGVGPSQRVDARMPTQRSNVPGARPSLLVGCRTGQGNRVLMTLTPCQAS